MAKFDYGGGCGCGLYRECEPNCEYNLSIKEENMTNDDFGFTLVGEEDILVKAPVDLRAEKLRDMVMPLLNNMKKNPDKDYIQWPGKERVKQIDAFIKKMNALIDG